MNACDILNRREVMNLSMKESILCWFPDWYKEIDSKKQYLVLTDDLDSYYSCNYLKRLFGIQIGGFYSFEKGLYLNEELTCNKEPIYIDLSITKGKTFDNHFTFIQNPLSINPNRFVSPTEYYKKYNGSTLALLKSIYSPNELGQLDNNLLSAILCIDSWYVGYYKSNGRYRDINMQWFDMLGYTDYVLPLLNAKNDQYFKDFALDNSLNAKIYIDEHGYLYSEANKDFPKCKFDLVLPITKVVVSRDEAESRYRRNPDSILISVETYKDKYILNVVKERSTYN